MPPSILVVEDSVTMRRILELTLAGEQMSVRVVADGNAALAVLQSSSPQEAPQVMVIDSSLPGMDGYQLATAVREQPSGKNISILMLTSAAFPLDATRARLAEADAHLDKPFETQALIAKLHELEAQAQQRAVSSLPPRLDFTSELEVPVTIGRESEVDVSFDLSVDLAPNETAHDVGRPAAFAATSRSSFPPPPSIPARSQSTTQQYNAQPAAPKSHPARGTLAVSTAGGDLRQRLQALGLNETQTTEVMALCQTVVERVAWEVVPDLAEAIVRAEIRRLTA